MTRLLRNTCLLLLLALLLPVLFLAQGPVFTTGQWTADRNLHDARTGACAATLPDGRTLATGGAGSSGPLTSAEYLSVAGDLTTVAPMNVARSEHVCAVLPDGRVLAAGGRVAGNAATNAAEIYDPAGNTWTNITSLREARIGAAVTVLADGRVLIAGGEASGAASATLEIFGPGSQSFALVSGAMSAPRKNLAAARLADGRVLLAGGSSGAGALATAEIFDPAVGAISPAGSMTSPRTGLSATALDNGMVLLAGGSNGAQDLATAELFDPTTGIFASSPSMGSPRRGHQAYLIPHNNNVLVVGGVSAGQPLASTEQFAWWTNSFTSLGSVSAARSLMTGGAGPTGFVTIAGGSLADGTASPKQDTILLPTVKTDKLDYQPGDTAVITGSGWKANETVGLSITETPDLDNDSPIALTAMADGAGNFSSTLPIDEADLGVKFVLVATGQTSGLSAEATFSDSANFQSVAVGPQSPVSIIPGGSATYTITLGFTGSGSTGCSATLSVTSGLPSGASVGFAPNPVSSTGANAASTLTISTTGAVTPGTYTFIVQAVVPSVAGGQGCNGGTITANGTLKIVGAPNSPPAITSTNASITVNEGQTANNTGNWSDANAGDTVTLSASVGSVTKSGPNSGGTWSWSFGSSDGPTQNQTVTITANDGTASTSVNFLLHVNNVSPTASFGNNGPVNEGSPANVSFTAQSDPSSVDTAAGFHYAYSCTNGDLSAATYAGSGTSATNPCTFNDNGTFSVKARILDKDDGFTEYTTNITVNNVAPTATLGNSGPIDEGSSATVSFTAPSDPSSADTTAGFHYAFSCTNASLAGATYAGSGTAANTTCTFDDNGTNTVRARILDKDNGFTEYTTDVVVKNVAPTATFAGPASANEGESKTYTFTGQHDPSTADTTAGFHYAYSCTGASLASATYAASGTAATTNCTFADNGTFTVRARILDKDDGSSEYTVTVTVANVAPTATAPADQIANEGSTVSFNLGSFSDPGVNDNPWTVNVDWGDATPPDSFTTAAQGVITAHSHKFDDGPNIYTVTVTVKDKDLGTSVPVTFKVTVANVAPIAILGNSGPIDEGSSATVTFTAPSDPSSADTTAGFHYAFSCTNASLAGATYAGSGSAANTSCTFDDNGTNTVRARILDKDNGFTEYTTDVVVKNVAPTATFTGPASANEGDSKTYTFASQHDPSTADTTAGFHYAYSCTGASLASATYAASGTAATTSCTFADNGTFTVRARILDKDDGSTEYTVTVTVANVAPTATAPGDQIANEGSTVSFNLGSFSDPGINDNPWTVNVDWGDATPPDSFTTAAQGVITAHSHKFDDGPNIYTVTVTVKDKDLGTSVPVTFKVTVANVAPIATFGNSGPVNEGSPFTLSLTSPSDPSTADTTAGFQYAFDCGSGYGAYGSSNSVSCTTNDNGSRAVKGKIKDKDNGETEYTATVIVNNVAPTAVLGNNGPVNEGSPATITFTGALDPSTVDTAAGFHYSYSCLGSLAGSYAAAGTSANANCTFPDNGSYVVTGRIFDKDNGFTDYTTTVTVNNVAPTLVAPGNQSSNEGSSIAFNLGMFSDPGVNDNPWHVSVDWGDGPPQLFDTTVQGVISQNHSYDDGPHPYTVKVTVTDKDGGVSNQISFNVTVANVSPIATFGNNGPVNEGSPFTLSLTSPSDPSTADTTAGFQYAFDCGSGYGAYGSSNSVSCTTNDNGSRAVKGKIKDKDNGETEYTATVIVNNVAPTANFAGPLTANEGETKPYTFAGATDPSSVDTAAGFRYAYSCDGSAIGIATYAAASTVATVNCTFPDNGSITVRGRILDKDSGYRDYSVAVTVANVAPSNLIVSLTSAAVNENGVATLNGSFIDPGVLDTHAVMINWGDGSLVTPLNLSAGVVAFSAPHQYLDDSPSGTKFDNYPILVSVMDKDGGSATPAGTSIRVNNVPPVIGVGADITVPVTPVAIPALLTINVNVPFTDVGTLDTHTCTIDWDDNGEQTSFPPTESGGNGSCLGTYSHTVAAAGVYTIRLTVQDDDTDSITYTDESLFVAYDPSGGFVTGGGWIDSPLGAYKPNPSLTGKANFGFVSKYQKGANVPTGDTEFQFKSGNLNFKSTSYDWLVVAGSKAQYKGNGTINGAGNYSFILTAIAGSGNNADRFRLKIQDGGGGVVYDSAVSGPDDIDNSPTTALGGGSIQVHK